MRRDALSSAEADGAGQGRGSCWLERRREGRERGGIGAGDGDDCRPRSMTAAMLIGREVSFWVARHEVSLLRAPAMAAFARAFLLRARAIAGWSRGIARRRQKGNPKKSHEKIVLLLFFLVVRDESKPH